MFLQDVRYALRVLAKAPGFACAAIAVLAVGIGVNTAVFTFVDGLVFKPMMGRDKPGEVVGLHSRDRARPDSYRAFSYANYADIRDRNAVFTDVMAHDVVLAGIREGDTTRRTLVAAVTANYFSTLGVSLSTGRSFTREEEQPGSGAAVVILSHDYWKARGANPSALGSTVFINARPYTVIGVAPKGFTGTVNVLAPEVWVPTGSWESVANVHPGSGGALPLGDRRSHVLMVMGRLRPGLSQEAAAPALARLSAEMERAFPAENLRQELIVRTPSRYTMSTAPQGNGSALGVSAIVMAMAACVLLIAGMNLANLVLARSTARRREIAMRLALGGTRARIVRQLLTEGFVLSLAGGAGGLLVSYWSGRLLWASLAALAPFPMRFDPAPGARVLLVTLGFCAFSTVLFALGPAWHLVRTSVFPQLKAGAGEDVGRARARWSGRDLLVASQVALSLGLLTTAGLLVQSAIRAALRDPGYRLEGQVLATLDASLAGYDEARARAAYRRVLERVRTLPGVEAASPASLVAFGLMGEQRAVRPAGAGTDAQPAEPSCVVVGSGYFRTLGVPLVRGRDFTPGEEDGAAGRVVAIVDQPLAAKLFGAGDPIGREIDVTLDDEQQPARALVVGVAGGTRQTLWDRTPVAHVYLPSGHIYRSSLNLHVRVARASSEAEVLQAVRREIRAADERLPVVSLQTLTAHRDGTTVYWAIRTMATIFSIFGLVAAFLAVTGVYAVKAYLVARRTREIGIRMALGSTPGGVLQVVLREGLAVTLGGLGVGFLLAIGIGFVVRGRLPGVGSFDPLVFAAAPLALAAASLVACYLPARRATRVSPTVALRTE